MTTRSPRSILALLLTVLLIAACGGGGGGGSASQGSTPLSNDAALSLLTLRYGQLSPAFQPGTLSYTTSVGYLLQANFIKAITNDPNASKAISSGSFDAQGVAVALLPGLVYSSTITVTAQDGSTTRNYGLTINQGDISSFVNRSYLKASTIGSEDEYGLSVAISGDTMVVGAPREDSAVGAGQGDNSKIDTGAVYVYTRSGDHWTLQAFLKGGNLNNARFGESVAINGDTLVVGEPGVSEGRAYAFTRVNNVWSQQAILQASNAEIGDAFGVSVAIDKDTIVVGAGGEDSADGATTNNSTGATDDDSLPEAGAAYVFNRTGTSWSQQAYLKADNAGSEDFFGARVAISGDYIVVGAPLEDNTSANGQFNSGAAYVYRRNGSAWNQVTTLKASNLGPEDSFGNSVAMEGDLIVVGAPGEDGPNELKGNSGAAYVFRLGTCLLATCNEVQILRAQNAGPNDGFGNSVDVSDQNIVVGASHETFTSTNGAAYVFTCPIITVRSDCWTQFRYLSSAIKTAGVIGSNTTLFGDEYGVSVAIDGDTVVLGANGEDSNTALDEANNSSIDSGAVYVWR